MNFDWLAGVPPVWGTIVHTLAWALFLLWVLRRSDDDVYRDADDRSRWRDLRLWIVPLAVVQIALYWLF